MSGPKKADVQAALNVARQCQAKCAALVSQAEDAALASLVREIDKTITAAAADCDRLASQNGSLTPELRRVAQEEARACDVAAQDARRVLDEARAALSQIHTSAETAAAAEVAARRKLEAAESEYERAASALRAAGDHYLRQEMEWAQQARGLFDQAAGELARASSARQKALGEAEAGLRCAHQARAAAAAAGHQLEATCNQAEARIVAAERARRIDADAHRTATLAVELARCALARLADTPHERFAPGESARLHRALESADGLLSQKRSADASMSAAAVAARAGSLESRVLAAAQAHQARSAEALAKISALRASVAGTDEQLIREWSHDRQARERALSALDEAERAMAADRFDDAARVVDEARTSLDAALHSAANCRGADDRRNKIGEAILDALEELGFDVSSEAGTRDAPMRISGQTPDEGGRGDFDIALPITGVIDFEVSADAGDTTCVAAIAALQQRLAERGIEWNTTDWGHASGNVVAVTRTEDENVKERIKEKATFMRS